MSTVPGADAAAPVASAATRATKRVPNPAAYIPPQCFTKTRTDEGAAKNPCYACHVKAPAPNYADDADLQVTLKLPPAAKKNPWTNLFDPPMTRAPRLSDDEVLRYVRESNYFDAAGHIVLADERADARWDEDKNGRWDGFVPDVYFVFDDHGFDHAPDGSPTGWRAFGYYPFLGTFFPTNGSTDDVLVRLDRAFRERADGTPDRDAYEINLAIVMALITREDVPIDPVDESLYGVDLDLDGRIARASRVAFDGDERDKEKTRMHYVGRAREEERAGRLAIAPGLFPVGTEFFHTVRYLDLGPDGAVRMAARMKEVRYAKKTRFLSYDALKQLAVAEAREQAETPDGARWVRSLGERGIDNGQGWVYQGFIEDARGQLRPQNREESAACAGCHGGIGGTVDGIFSLPRKVSEAEAQHGWFHWSQRGLAGLKEPKRRDGTYEYTAYLQHAGGGDEFRENGEVMARFFDASGALVPTEVDRLHEDVTRLLLPSAPRALDLDRAYRAIVAEQSFVLGRDAVLAPAHNVYAEVRIGEPTGIAPAVPASRLVRNGQRALLAKLHE
jgi:hypothetical protein